MIERAWFRSFFCPIMLHTDSLSPLVVTCDIKKDPIASCWIHSSRCLWNTDQELKGSCLLFVSTRALVRGGNAGPPVGGSWCNQLAVPPGGLVPLDICFLAPPTFDLDFVPCVQGGSGQRGRSEHPDSGWLEGVQTEQRGGGGELQGAERRLSALRLRLGGLELPGPPENLEVQKFELKPNSDLVPVAETRSKAKTHFYFYFCRRTVV